MVKKGQLISVLRTLLFFFFFWSAWAPGFVFCALCRVLHPTCLFFFPVGEVLCLCKKMQLYWAMERKAPERSQCMEFVTAVSSVNRKWTLFWNSVFIPVFLVSQQNGLVAVGMGKRRRSPSVSRDFLGLQKAKAAPAAERRGQKCWIFQLCCSGTSLFISNTSAIPVVLLFVTQLFVLQTGLELSTA